MRGIKAILISALTLAAGLSLFANNLAVTAADKADAVKAAGENTGNPIVTMTTNKGTIKIKLFKKEAPVTTNNFVDLVNRKFYDGVTFHRYEPGFVIQGGDPTGTGTGNFEDPKTHKTRHIKLEKVASLKHDKAGMMAMARTADPNSASCQFYFTLAPANFLDDPPGYAVFGEVVEGLDVVQKLRKGDKMTRVTVQ